MTVVNYLTQEFFALNPKTWNVSLLDGVLATSLMLVIFGGFSTYEFNIFSQIVVLICIVRPNLIRNPYVWLALASLATYALITNWLIADNHKYLFVYWLWVIFIALIVNDELHSNQILRFHARFFIVFVFLIAALQKIFSPTYMTGEMFEFWLLIDDRFHAFGKLVGIDPNILRDAEFAIRELKGPTVEFIDNAILIPSTDRVHTVAMIITWYDMIVQFTIGTLFLARRHVTDMLGHVVLLFFIFTTYIPAPVYGFGWTIAIYGFTLAKDKFTKLTVTYALAFIAVLFYQLPWRQWVLGL
jgi:hypothetical protein